MIDRLRSEEARRQREELPASAIALTLRAVGGLTTAEIAAGPAACPSSTT